MAAGVAFTAWSYQQIEQASNHRRDSRTTLTAADDFLADLTVAEAAQRGYVLTSDETYLEPYPGVRDNIKAQLAVLRQLTTSAPAQHRLDVIAPLLETKLAGMDKTIAARRNQDAVGAMALINSGEGMRLMDAIRKEMRGVVQIETDIQAQHNVQFDQSMRRLFAIIIAIGMLALLLALYFAYASYRGAQQRQKNLQHEKTEHLLEEQVDTNALLVKINDALQDSTQKLTVTLNSIGDAVITTDAQACVTLLNPVAQNLTGWTQPEALGRPISEVFKIVNKADRHSVTVPVAEALAHGTIQGLANHTVLIARDGREFDIADSCAPVRDLQGLVVGAVLVFRNVTAEYAAQQTLRDSAARILAVLNTVGDGIVTLQAQGGRIESTNPAIEQLFGYPTAELKGKAFGLLIPELDHEQHSVALEHYAATEAARTLGQGREVMGFRKDGSSFPLEIAVTEMKLGGQRFFTGIVRDISARKRVEAERTQLDTALQLKNTELEAARATADKANQAKSEFLSSMSHELRSPLNAILGFAQLMDSGVPPPTAAQKGSIKQILKAGWYLLELINEILDLALVESGKLSLSMEPVSLEEVLRDCQTMIEPQAGKRSVHMRFPHFTTPCFVEADRTRVKQVFVNLLTNAIKYNRPNGSVEVSFRTAGKTRVHISVHDSGEGLSAKRLTQLFQPFNRLGREGSDEEGTGIGLVVSKRLVELMGGSIGANSTVGLGSEFWIELNLAEPFSLALEAEEDEPQPAVVVPDGSAVRTLLYVEDNAANMELVAQLIARRTDVRLLHAADGVRGIAMARTYLPDLILMDINLPGISGLQALALLHEDSTTTHIPVLALSANAMPHDVEKGLEAGFFRYLTKPIKIAEFMLALDQGLELDQAKPYPTLYGKTPLSPRCYCVYS
jgi:PAS domain S-box-containing protein